MKMLVNIDVPNLEHAEAFYCHALGLHKNRRLDDDVSELVGGSSTVYLLRNDAGSTASRRSAETRHYDRHWTPVHVDFVVEDVQVAAMRAIEAGAVQESACVEWRGSKCITFSDPFGNGFCLIEFEQETYQ